ncbi:Signal transduction histidine kinase [Halogranum rubrum]|uniref:histidine kinase n=1 Tax=Halogranum rubrum TaxID=553466 RepID=A0A1I4AR98_9EURY|nr:histidine kinase N-terminal 7TM domain-containing protein [Halogranum rubrum]SFK59015.1 Signal transduction histidine kinase [Halogranum rubrum]
MDYLRLETFYIGVLFLSSAVNVGVAVWLRTRSANEQAVRLFTVLLLLHPIVGLVVVAELLAPSQSLAFVFYGIHNTTLVAINVVWFAFTLAYANRTRILSRPVVGLIVGYFVGTATLEVTNTTHRAVWRSYRVVTDPFPYVEGEPTLLFLVLTTGMTLFHLAGIGVLGYHLLFGPSRSSRRTATLLAGFTMPLVILVLWGLGMVPGPLNGAFIVGSTVSLSFVAWAVFRHQLFDVVPLARERVFEELDEIVLVVDPDYHLLDYNQSAKRAFPELVGATGSPLVEVLPHLLDGDSFTDSFTTYENGRLDEYTVDASLLTVDTSIRGYGVIIRNVTERQQHIRDLEQQTMQLERFASTLSHDLRNPLNVAQGWIDVTIESGDLQHLERSQSALDRMDQIISDLLTLAREGRAIDDHELVRVRIVDIFEDAWETTTTAGARYELELDADVVLYADETRLRNVFENLVRNAVEHGSAKSRSGSDPPVGSGDGAVTITLGRLVDGFYVEDDGPGIPLDQHQRVFDYEYTTAKSGTGLGLAIVESIANAHGWTVTMSNGPDGGARISFTNVELVDAEVERPTTS